MLNQGTLDYLGVNIGDKVEYYLNISLPGQSASAVGKNPRMPLIELMAFSAGVDLSTIRNTLEQSAGPTGLNLTVAAAFDKSNGKFPSAYGNVALLDCHYVFGYILDYERAEINIKYANQPI